ncbi:MAG TPA: hypothetical protein VIC82_13605 [Candidatus Nanopelagicales bacterium]
MITETKIGARVFGVPEHSGPGWVSFARTDRAVSTRPRMAAAPTTANLPAAYLSQFFVTDLGTSTKAQEPPRGAPR